MNSRKLQLLVAISGVLTVPNLAWAQTDDSTWINTAIQNAISAGQTSYTLPAGTFRLSNPIVIPQGTKNFALMGAGPAATTITCNRVMPNAIVIGASVLNVNNWGLTNQVNHKLASIGNGNSAVTLLSGEAAPTVDNYYVLYDSNKVTHRITTSWSQNNRGEIVKVKSYSTTSRSAGLYNTTGRPYSVSPMLANVNSIVSLNIGVHNLGFDGRVETGGSVDNFVSASLTDGLNISNLKIRNYKVQGILLNLCKNAAIWQIDVADPTSTVDGEGYGIQISRSRFVNLADINAANNRHAVVVHCGSMDVIMTRVNVQQGGGLDTHGFDERRIKITFSNLNRINLGNTSWLAGGVTFTVEDTTVTNSVYLNPNVDGVMFRRCNIGTQSASGSVITTNIDGSTGVPSKGYPKSVTFDTCNVGADQYFLVVNANKFGTLTFSKSTLYSRLVQGTVLTYKSGSGTLQFTDCIVNSPANWTMPFQLTNTVGQALTLSIQRTKFNGIYTTSAVDLQAGYLGSANLQNNTLDVQDPTGRTFVRVATGVRSVTNTNNLVQ